ncbi:hypothetical protein ACG904_14080 [Acinetobacter guillouiae]|uniref:hypothetical protein n=1 Tax=Acinetobacter guillouiae TaxID=106649 RepID=UPI003AF6FEB2
MDIQKEREAFENWWEGFHNGRQIACDYVEEDNSYSVGYANAQWVAWQAAKAQAVPEGFVLVPKECPDPIFADKLFDHLCKKAHGEFGDDQMIFFSDIDESAIWQLMIEAQEQSHD